ncbi:Uncharacterized protein PECH_008817 [Penicillium ucsense]|uniref:RRM domain-containing protein n=1 Tax=Penicillium ucsense TaxID=2839758 RepID=A0A8J8WJE6_9EURO|nr:Uncharacterized protein PECM_001528 [Penicillium ucsense]KAF7733880.1 Uncharacterized protein PECH_008817 [Penicillium ucsense]
MLGPFQIRDLHAPSTSESEVQIVTDDGRNSHGVVEVSATDYDQIAASHPRARLTYFDADDGDQITVGSSLELSQRLDEPPEETTPDNLGPEPTSMHIFDIHRSNSITEIWRNFEKPGSNFLSKREAGDSSVKQSNEEDNLESSKDSRSSHRTTVNDTQVEDQPFMAAFEAELANLLSSAENTGPRDANAETSSAANSSTADPRRPQHQLEVIATTFLYHLVHGANSVQSELRSRLPELRDQLRTAQRTVPDNVRSSLQHLLASIEVHMRTAYQHIPENGRHFAQDAFQAGRPVAESAADGLRTIASELNEASKALYAAFETELNQFSTNGLNSWFERAQGASSAFPTTSTGRAASPSAPQAMGVDIPTCDVQGARPNVPVPSYSRVSVSRDSKAQGDTLWCGFSNLDNDTARNSNIFPNSDSNPPPTFSQRTLAAPSTPWPVHPSHQQHSNVPLWAPWVVSQPAQNTHHPLHSVAQGHNLQPLTTTSSSSHAPRPSDQQSSSRPATSSARHDHNKEPTEISEKKVLFVGNVGFQVTERMIREVFSSKGFVVTVRLPRDSDTGNHAGFGFIEFPSIHPAMAAMDALQGVHIDGHAINLEFSDDSIVDPNESSEYVPSQRATLFETFSSKECRKPPQPAESSNAQPASPRESCQKPLPIEEPDWSSLYDHSQDGGSKEVSSPRTTSHLVDSIGTRPRPAELHSRLPNLSHFPPVFQTEAQQFSSQQSTVTENPWQMHETRDMPSPALGTNTEALHLSQECLTSRQGELASGVQHPSAPTSTPLGVPGVHGLTPMERGFDMNSACVNSQSSRNSYGSRPWARLDKRERRRSRDASSLGIPGSFPAETNSSSEFTLPKASSTDVQQSEMDHCVSSLIDLGYGTVEQGGRSRLAIYAAASNGVLSDAIDIIEEETKAYDRRRQN